MKDMDSVFKQFVCFVCVVCFFFVLRRKLPREIFNSECSPLEHVFNRISPDDCFRHVSIISKGYLEASLKIDSSSD